MGLSRGNFGYWIRVGEERLIDIRALRVCQKRRPPNCGHDEDGERAFARGALEANKSTITATISDGVRGEDAGH